MTRTSSAAPCRSSNGIWASRFIRIHRSTIVNLDRIRGLELQSGGEYEVVLESKRPIAVEPALPETASGSHGRDVSKRGLSTAFALSGTMCGSHS